LKYLDDSGVDVFTAEAALQDGAYPCNVIQKFFTNDLTDTALLAQTGKNP